MNRTQRDWATGQDSSRIRESSGKSMPRQPSRSKRSTRDRSHELPQQGVAGRSSRALCKPRNPTWSVEDTAMSTKTQSVRSSRCSSDAHYHLASSPVEDDRPLYGEGWRSPPGRLPSPLPYLDDRFIGAWCEDEPKRLSALPGNLAAYGAWESHNQIDPVVVPFAPSPPGVEMAPLSSDYAFCLCCDEASGVDIREQSCHEERINDTWCLRKPESKMDAQRT